MSQSNQPLSDTIFLSGPRDVSDLLSQAYSAIQLIGGNPELGGRTISPYYWELEEETERQATTLSKLPRSTDDNIIAAVFILSERLGEPIPTNNRYPREMESFLSSSDTPDDTQLPLTYTSFEFIDWVNENRSRRDVGQEPIPGYLYIRGDQASIQYTGKMPLNKRGWGKTSLDSQNKLEEQPVQMPSSANEDNLQLQWLDSFFEFFFRPVPVDLPGFRQVRFVNSSQSLFENIRQDLSRELNLTTKKPWIDVLCGAQAFSVDHHHELQGRGTETQMLTNWLIDKESHPCCILSGSPNCGKTSLLQAGLLGTLHSGNLSNAHQIISVLAKFPVCDNPNQATDEFIVDAVLDSITPSIASAVKGKIDQSKLKNAEYVLTAIITELGRTQKAMHSDSTQKTILVCVDDAGLKLCDKRSSAPERQRWQEIIDRLLVLSSQLNLKLLLVCETPRSLAPVDANNSLREAIHVKLDPITNLKLKDALQKTINLCQLRWPWIPAQSFINALIAWLVSCPTSDETHIAPMAFESIKEFFLLCDTFTDEPSMPEDFTSFAADMYNAAVHRVCEEATTNANAALQIKNLLRSHVRRIKPYQSEQYKLVAKKQIVHAHNLPDLERLIDSFDQFSILHIDDTGASTLNDLSIIDKWTTSKEWIQNEDTLLLRFGELEAAFHHHNVMQLPNPVRFFKKITWRRIGWCAWFLHDWRFQAGDVNVANSMANALLQTVSTHYDPTLDHPDNENASVVSWMAALGYEPFIRHTLVQSNGDISHFERGEYPVILSLALNNQSTLLAELLSAGCRA